MVSRMERRTKGEADLVVFCHERSESLKEVERSRSESMFSFVILHMLSFYIIHLKF